MTTPSLHDPPDGGAVCRLFGLGRAAGPATPAARGELGRIWRLPTDRGPWAVKELLHFEPATVRASASADAAFQEIAFVAGIPMPRPIRTVDGEVIADVGAGIRERLVRVYEWVDLAGRDVTPALVDVATILGRLHEFAPRDPRPMQTWFTRSPAPDVWAPRRLAAARAGATWAAALADIVPILLETTRAARWRDADGRITCHLDFNPENVLVRVDGRPIVVDWENSGPAPAEQELASVVAEFVRDPADTPRFLDAYEAGGGPGRLVDRSSFAMTAVVQANLIETYSRWALDTAAPAEDRARAADWVVDIAENVFTVERFDAWLDAGRSRSPRAVRS